MTIHVPTVSPHHAPAIAGVGLALLAIAVLALIGAIVIVPSWAPATDWRAVSEGTWMTDQRHGEIDAGRSGPHADVLLYRQGEINAANE